MKKFFKILTSSFVCVLVICTICCIVYRYEIIKREKEKAKMATIGYTEYNLSTFNLTRLLVTFDICPPEYRKRDFLENYEYSPKKKELKLEAGENTEQYIKDFNNLVFYDSKGKKLKVVAESYGFNEDNQFTLEWILTHPKELCEITEADQEAVRDIR